MRRGASDWGGVFRRSAFGHALPAGLRCLKFMRTRFLIPSLLVLVSGCIKDTFPTSHAATISPPYLLHLPGIAGRLWIDDAVTRGLKEGGIGGTIEVYNWAGIDRGLPALGFVKRHREQARIVADKLIAHVRQHPGSKITLISHSAGCGIAIYALEQLPDDVGIDALLMMHSALSPEYDLSNALRHVTRAYSFHSSHDMVLDWGTRAFGTLDRRFSTAAGRVSYSCPAAGDNAQYAKLTQFDYDRKWLKLGNRGDHIGPMDRKFGREMLAPLLLTGKLPDVSDR